MKTIHKYNNSQLLEHKGYCVSLKVDKLTGGWYAYGDVYAMPGAEQSLSDVKRFWGTKNPNSWGFRNRADALKARTRIKREIAARIAARNFEGNYFEYT